MGPPSLPNSLLLPEENLDLCLPLEVGGVCWGGGVSLSFLEIGQLSIWQGGKLGKGLEDPDLRCPLTCEFPGLL